MRMQLGAERFEAAVAEGAGTHIEQAAQLAVDALSTRH